MEFANKLCESNAKSLALNIAVNSYRNRMDSKTIRKLGKFQCMRHKRKGKFFSAHVQNCERRPLALSFLY